MKTKILLVTLLLISNFSFAQTINNNWPQGKFKLNISNLNYTTYLSAKNTFWMQMTDKKGGFNFFTVGSYKVKNDTVLFYLDKSAYPLKALYKKNTSTTNNTKTIVITIDSLNYISSNDFKIATGNSFKKDQLVDFTDSISIEEGTKKKSIKVKLPVGDSLYVTHSRYPSSQLTVFALPKNVQQIRLKFNDVYFSNSDVVTCVKGENANELIMIEHRKPFLSFFYVGNVSNEEDKLLIAQKDIPDNGFDFLPRSRVYTDTSVVKKSDYDYDTEEYVKKDTIKIYTNFEEAQRLAKEQNKFLVLYCEKVASKEDSYYSFQQFIKEANTESYIKTDYFNKNFVLYNVPESDLKRLKGYGVKSYPGTVILAPTGQLLYYSYGKSFYELQSNFTYSSYLFAEKLWLVYNKSVLMPQLQKEPDNTKLQEAYLNNIPDYYGFYDDAVSVSDYEKSKDKFESSMDYSIDGSFVLKSLNKLVIGYSLGKADTTNAKLILKVLGYLANSKSMNADDFIYSMDAAGIPQFTPAFDYLIRNYNGLSAYTYTDNDYYKQPKTLYVLLSKLINADKYNEVDREKGIIAQQIFIEALPQVIHYEVPLLIRKEIYYAYDKLLSNEAIGLLDKYAATFGAKKDVLSYAKSLFKQLVADSISYDYVNSTSTTYSYSSSDDKASDAAFIYQTADLLNSAAWKCYQFSTDDGTLTKALNWSVLSVELEAENPYFIDTRAHLLYRLAHKEQAIEQQQKAVNIIKAKKGDQTVTDKQILIDLRKMIAGTLSTDSENSSADNHYRIDPPKVENLVASEVYEKVEVAPVYEGGEKAMKAFINDQLNYPIKALNAHVSGTVFISFVITSDGSIANINVDKSLGYGCDEEATRLVKSMAIWEPGKMHGKPVNVKYTLPVKFELPN
ncbi:energy transducer TonB [Solitalea canadensis]|uniref:TonB family protein n=1 Tax=Solitalea canadensis (strain ATCC 29591 / DSM 3403 / JCM 21819 / LMG 8368 / NBRC 15130 / NCIMB 12057 / USAM 9D) TaxID=929556 RepID=H8KQC3_SOLCM|nr:energy transducer TonB [Solitalea canadensis]AFD06418.1 TonB family protein [Solitalea canadensis DSM 3403]